jgi:hypothetical protein
MLFQKKLTVSTIDKIPLSSTLGKIFFSLNASTKVLIV